MTHCKQSIDHRELISSLLTQNTPVCFQAGGQSMTPTLLDGERVQLRPVRPKDLRCGAILLYRNHDRLILHRMIRKGSENRIHFIGDAALSGDEQINARELLGVATTVQRAGRTIPLDTRTARLRGMIRYWIRPVRRLIWGRCHPPHTAASTSKGGHSAAEK